MAAPMSPIIRRLPVVVILGATGTGKSKLALQIGAKFGGEIISADSMQVYKGLDIITNKVTSEEKCLCPHHLIDFLNPLSRYTVVDFRNKALPIVERLLKEQRLPVIVGGTNYYIEALLWKVLLNTQQSASQGLLLHANGDPVTLSICRKCRYSETRPSVAKKPAQRDADFDSTRICNMASDSIKDKSVRSCDSPIDEGLSELEHQSEVTSFREPLSMAGSSQNHSLQQEPECDTSEDPNLPKRDRRQDPNCTTQGATVDCDQQNVLVHVHVDPPSSDGRENVPIQTDQAKEPIHHSDLDEFVVDSSRAEIEQHRNDEMMTIDVEGTETNDLYKILVEVDPCRAGTLHPNNRRKIIRSLQVYEQHGQPHSDLLSDQQQEVGGGPLGGPLRFNNVCILWLQCDLDVLDKRLDGRVHDMLDRGLLKELTNFHQEYNRQRVEAQADRETLYTQGIFQSIGFKEFHPYLILPQEVKESEEGTNLLKEGVEKLKIATRQYARRQNRWVKNRFIRRPGKNVPPVYALSSTNPTLWDENVLQPALAILGAVIEGKDPAVSPLEAKGDSSMSPSQEASARHVCDVCGGRVFVGKQQWLGHLRSKRHYKKTRKLKLASQLKSYEEKLFKSDNTDREENNTEVHGEDR